MAKYCCKVIKMVLKSLFGNTLKKSLQYMATSPMVDIEVQLTGLCIIQMFTKRFIRKTLK